MKFSANIKKSLRMAPEVSQIFDDIEAWHDYCRETMTYFSEADVYRSREYRIWASENGRKVSYLQYPPRRTRTTD